MIKHLAHNPSHIYPIQRTNMLNVYHVLIT